MPTAPLDESVAPPAAPLVHRLSGARGGEKETLFFSLLLILSLAYAGFALASVWLGFGGGAALSALALVLTGALALARRTGASVRSLSVGMQGVLLVHAAALAWLTGGIYSPALGWLALAPFPAVLLRSIRSSVVWLGAVCAILLLLYAHAWLGGVSELALDPSHLMHWHMGMAVLILVAQIVMLYRFQALRRRRLVQLYQRNRQLQATRRDLKASQKHKDRFVAAVSHELRTPMTAILGLADVIEQSEGLSTDTREKIRGIQRSATHLLATINDLLDYSQMEAGKLQIHPHVVDLHATAAAAFNLLKHRAVQKHIDCRLHIAADVPQWVRLDDHRLTQVLVNLLGNSVKFTAQGFIELRCLVSATNGQGDGESVDLVFEIEDSGAGMEPEQLERLFCDYAQANVSIARQYGGNGLGLSISRGLVLAMRGQIAVRSQPGVGTCFTVQLPTTRCAAPVSELVSDPIERPELRMRVLLAEDEPINRQVAQLIIKKSLPQVTIDEAVNGVQAVHMAQDKHYDLVLMDLVMPELGGLAAAEAIRQLPQPERSQVPIVALTAHTDRDIWEQCRSVGMNGILLKPYDRAKLLAAIVQHAPVKPQS